MNETFTLALPTWMGRSDFNGLIALTNVGIGFLMLVVAIITLIVAIRSMPKK